MFNNTVLKKHFYVILGLLLLITGCATPLMNAAWSNDIKKIETLLNKGADVNASASNGDIALRVAVCMGRAKRFGPE